MTEEKIPPFKLNKYKVMRVLHSKPQTYEEILAETELEEGRLNSAIKNLVKNNDIRKQKIILKEKLVTLDGGKRNQIDLFEPTTNTKTTVEYELSPKGHDKLVYFELMYNAFKKWVPRYEQSIQDFYLEDISIYVQNNKHKFKSKTIADNFLQNIKHLVLMSIIVYITPL
jgi:hypothetical protein